VKKLIVLLALMLTATWSFSLAKDKDKEKDKKNSVDSGTFGIFLNGKRIGTEKFNIEQQADEGVVTAALTVDDGNSNKSEQGSELRVSSDGNLRLYKWRSTVPTKEESIVEPKDQFLVEHLSPADQKKRDVPYILPLSTVILDDNFFSQREVLIWRYLAAGCMPKEGQLHCGPSRFGTLVPRQHIAGSATVELMGRDKIMYKGAEKELNKIKIDADGVQWLLWVDDPENHYKVIKMSIPSGNIDVWRD